MKGIKIEMQPHTMIHKWADGTGWGLTCSCGWQRSLSFPARVHPELSRREQADHFADHVRHMSLVHDVQTHADNNCASLCIYPKPKGQP